MQKYIVFFILMALNLLDSKAVIAHSGHDHAHWSSNYLHLLFFASILAVVLAIGYIIGKCYFTKRHSHKS